MRSEDIFDPVRPRPKDREGWWTQGSTIGFGYLWLPISDP